MYFTVFILKNNESPLKNTPSSIDVKPGLGLQLDVKRKKFKQFNQWPFLYSECLVDEDNTLLEHLDDSTLFQQAMANKYSYSQDSCLLFCFNVFMSQVCNCSAFWVSGRQQGLGYCLAEQSSCVDNFYFNKFNIGTFIEDNCISKCPLQCDIHRFDNHQSFYKYPEPLYVKNTLQKNEMLIRRHSNQTDFSENLASNVVKFSVSYDSLVYAEAREEAKIPWDTFLGTIGCHLHLFLGMSAISIVEILELLVQINIYLFSGSNSIFE